jgi:hypothetical protein
MKTTGCNGCPNHMTGRQMLETEHAHKMTDRANDRGKSNLPTHYCVTTPCGCRKIKSAHDWDYGVGGYCPKWCPMREDAP